MRFQKWKSYTRGQHLTFGICADPDTIVYLFAFVDLIKVPFALLIFFMEITLHILEKWGEEGMNEYL